MNNKKMFLVLVAAICVSYKLEARHNVSQSYVASPRDKQLKLSVVGTVMEPISIAVKAVENVSQDHARVVGCSQHVLAHYIVQPHEKTTRIISVEPSYSVSVPSHAACPPCDQPCKESEGMACDVVVSCSDVSCRATESKIHTWNTDTVVVIVGSQRYLIAFDALLSDNTIIVKLNNKGSVKWVSLNEKTIKPTAAATYGSKRQAPPSSAE